jgi:hypothetical protein
VYDRIWADKAPLLLTEVSSSTRFSSEQRHLAKLTFVANESARGPRGYNGPQMLYGVAVLLPRESSIVRAALEAALCLEFNP